MRADCFFAPAKSSLKVRGSDGTGFPSQPFLTIIVESPLSVKTFAVLFWIPLYCPQIFCNPASIPTARSQSVSEVPKMPTESSSPGP